MEEKMIELKIKKINEDCKIPTKSSDQAAGYDIYAYIQDKYIEILPHTSVKINTRICHRNT